MPPQLSEFSNILWGFSPKIDLVRNPPSYLTNVLFLSFANFYADTSSDSIFIFCGFVSKETTTKIISDIIAP